MKLYERAVSKRQAINNFGKLGYVRYLEFVLTDDIEQFNKRKRIKFTESEHYKQSLARGIVKNRENEIIAYTITECMTHGWLS